MNLQKIIFLFSLIIYFSAHAKVENSNWSNIELDPLKTFFIKEQIPQSTWPDIVYLQQSDLPQKERFILTQPLLTAGIAQYYQRTPKIRPPLHEVDNPQTQQFYRAIIMIVDNDAKRDDALLADVQNDSTVVELGLISIHFAALPKAVVEGVRKSEIPFGALLLKHKVATDSINTRYFKMSCDKELAKYLQCKVGQTLYGRSNTIVREDNHVWLAHVVEILSPNY